MVKISVIVPVYKVECYLETCLDSIAHQTMVDIEIICVDDGSTDSSGKIIDRYAAVDKRFIVLHKRNAGYGAALNDGLRIAVGQYIGIVESDDRIAPNMFEELYKTASQNNLDFVKSDAFYWYENINYLKRIHDKSINELYDRVLGEKDRNTFFDFFMNIWTGIYKKEFLWGNNIKFNESPGASYQDNGFWLQTCFYAKRVMWMNEAFYYYRQDNPEASVKSNAKMMAMTKEYEYVEKLVKEREQEQLLPYVYSYRLVRLKGTFHRIADEKKYDFVKQIEEDYQKYKAYIKNNRYVDGWIRELLEAPVEYCDKVISDKKKVKEMIKGSEGVVIYGAGRQADIIMRILYNEGMFEKIKCFAVSEEMTNRQMASKDILRVEDAKEYFSGAVFILAVAPGTNAYYNMRERLKQLGINDYLQMTDFLEKFNYI